MKNHFDDLAVLLGRVLIAVLFLGGAVQKTLDPVPAMELLAMRGLPDWLVWLALGFNLAAGVALVLGWQMRIAATCAAVYCAVTSLFHFLPDDPWQMTIFVNAP